MGKSYRYRHRASQHGMALLTAVIFITVAALLLGALTMRVVNQARQVDNYVVCRNCFWGAETGVAASKASLEMGGTGLVGLGTWTPPSTTEIVLPSFDDPRVAPLTLASMPRLQYMGYLVDWGNDGRDNNGDGVVDDPQENWFYTIYGLSRLGQRVERAVEVVVHGQDVNVWRNAIFGGTGQSGGLINGNVSIHGSVHLLGDNIVPGGTAVTALDLSGTSLIHNNYVGIPAALQQRVPPLPTRVFNGEVVETLNATLRVRKGYVGLSGNSEIGEIDTPGNGYKETMDGIYVNDGWTGNAVVPDGGRGDPRSVWSDNGWDMLYDLGNRVPLPVLSDDWKDMYTGQTVLNPVTGRNYTHSEYFQTLCGTPYNGNLTIKANQDFYFNATRPGDPNPANRQPTDDYILFNATTNRMEINGQIQINGNLTFTRGAGNDKTIYYTGKAAILVNGDVTLDTDLLTLNADGSAANSFPKNIIGIMAQGNMTVGSLSQLQLMGAFYAQNQIKSEKQTITMGTFVSNYFDMGTNVPEIYQVPTLADNLPYGMIGAYPILAFSQVSWREIPT
ncbi:MAG TPA: hypothetical protein PKY35_12870 [Candidatus Hydrogenedentes bacterium]|nr:hypothetical protein [Candidatus Hydrogenedentota bacterium]HOL77909.1 hypothetical protein [Candidatus Hydrogenedentota bacterium]HPO87121.1 hypothetical protein [Candidatus Hydrogenedentota bacterium]